LGGILDFYKIFSFSLPGLILHFTKKGSLNPQSVGIRVLKNICSLWDIIFNSTTGGNTPHSFAYTKNKFFKKLFLFEIIRK
jgi:hypothetical protein